MFSEISFCLCLGFCGVFAAAQTTTRPSTEKVLYQQQFGEGQQLVVSKSPIVLASSIKNLLPASIIDRPVNPPTAFFSIDVEVRLTSGASLRLWSEHLPIHGRPPEYPSEYDDYQVLDVGILPNRILLAMSTWGSQIYVYDITVYGQKAAVGLNPIEWSHLAAALPVTPGRLGAKFSYDEKQNKVEIEVTDFLQETKLHTKFRQKGTEWAFERVKQWEETVPATQPAAK